MASKNRSKDESTSWNKETYVLNEIVVIIKIFLLKLNRKRSIFFIINLDDLFGNNFHL